MAKAKVTEKMFKAVKQLTEGGATISEIAEYFLLGHSTVSRMRAAETWEDYTHTIQAIALSCKKKKAEKSAEKAEQPKAEQKEEPQEQPQKVIQQNVTIQATHYMMQEMQKTNELLKLISNKLAFIVDQLQ